MVAVSVTIVTVPMRHDCCSLCNCHNSHTWDQMVVVTVAIVTVSMRHDCCSLCYCHNSHT